jgi:hypothetical protein
MAKGQRYKTPEGWVVQAFCFALDLTAAQSRITDRSGPVLRLVQNLPPMQAQPRHRVGQGLDLPRLRRPA